MSKSVHLEEGILSRLKFALAKSYQSGSTPVLQSCHELHVDHASCRVTSLIRNSPPPPRTIIGP